MVPGSSTDAPEVPNLRHGGVAASSNVHRPLLTQRYPTNRWVRVQRPALARRQGSAVDEEEAGRFVLVLLLMALAKCRFCVT